MINLSKFQSLIDPKLFDWPTTRNRLSKVLDLSEMERLARKRIPKFVYDYVAGASYREETAAANRSALAQYSLRPRTMQGVGQTSTAQKFLGHSYSLPVGIAPTGLTSLVHKDGELAGVRAAQTHNIPFVLSTMSTYSIEEVAAAAPNADRWFQLYLRKKRQESVELINRAKESGYSTLVLTVDTAVPGNRLRDTRNGLSLPPKVSLRNAASAFTKPSWSLGMLQGELPTMANFRDQSGNLSDIVANMFDPDQSWEDFDLVRKHWDGHLIVKGVLHPSDAREFMERGADSIWVSNHGGRQLDRALPSIEALRHIRSELGPEVPLLLDSGVRSGADVLTALAAGASFTFIGRSYIYGLAAGGELGVERTFDILHNEILNTLQLLGAKTVNAVLPDLVVSTKNLQISNSPISSLRMEQVEEKL